MIASNEEIHTRPCRALTYTLHVHQVHVMHGETDWNLVNNQLKPWEQSKKPWKNQWTPWVSQCEHHGTIDQHHEQSIEITEKSMQTEQSINTMETSMNSANGTIIAPKFCKLQVFAPKCSPKIACGKLCPRLQLHWDDRAMKTMFSISFMTCLYDPICTYFLRANRV